MNTELQQRIEDFLSNLNSEIDIAYLIDIDELDLNDASSIFDEMYNQIENGGGFDIDIIYYSRAIEYLKENDPSLNESLEIATEYGYETQNLNSEVLASLLASRNARDEFNDLESEITQFFEDIQEELEQLDEEE